MESLPELALCSLCRYLTDRDVFTCTAVCKSWRLIFDSDIIWFGRSNAALGDHLRNNVSVVDPKFAIPDGPLQPPCLLRLACMREKHLWSNWEHGRTNEMVVNQGGYSDHILAYTWGFMSDDFVYITFVETLEVWNVREDVATKVFEKVHRLSEKEVLSFAIIGDNKEFAIASDGYRAKVFDVDNRVGSISEKYVLDLKILERISAPPMWVDFELNCANLGSLLFTTVATLSNSIIVWNLNTGQFVKEDQLPREYNVVKNMKGSKSSDAIAVVTDSHTHLNYVYVYCRKHQVFFDFEETMNELLQCEICNEFIAFWGEDLILKVFNYRTSELIFQKYVAVYQHLEWGNFSEVDYSYVLMSVGGHFIYTDIIFDPLSKSEIKCAITGYENGYKSMQSIDQLRALRKGGWVQNKESFEFFELRKGRGNTKLGLEIKGTEYIEVSPCCTKIIYLHGTAWSSCLRIQKLW